MADFRAIYHLGWSEAIRLPGPEFLALAFRCSAYTGVMQARVLEQDRNASRNTRGSARMVEPERQAIETDPLLAGVIEFG